jgi:hypothetical protein
MLFVKRQRNKWHIARVGGCLTPTHLRFLGARIFPPQDAAKTGYLESFCKLGSGCLFEFLIAYVPVLLTSMTN